MAPQRPLDSNPENLHLVRAYGLYRKIFRYSGLLDRIRSLFLEVLIERGLTTKEKLEETVREWMRGDGITETEDSRREYREAAIDLLFASSMSMEEIENYINLARKRDKCQELGRVVNSEHATPESVFRTLKEFCDIPKGELYISPAEAEGIRVALISYYITKHLPLVGIAKEYVTIRDVHDVLEHTIGHVRHPGMLGGKAAGMILAQKILLPILSQRDPELEKYVCVPDTWYVSSGVFSDFIERNNFHFAHTHKYMDREAMDEEYQRIGVMFEAASFPADIVDEFRGLLQKIGGHPIIVRSSSYLEDSFGFAFSGKYKSIFLANGGDLETRLAGFIRGIKQVLVSMYGPDPILYRKDHGLLDYNERMAVIVQKVVGRRLGDHFFPFASGVMFSANPYTWNSRIKRGDGLVRLVFGLGTRAVDRVGGDYPRMVPLGQPLLRPEATAEKICRYSQKMVDTLNLRSGTFETVDFLTLARETGHPDMPLAVSIFRDGDLRAPLFKTQDLTNSQLCLTFENFLTKSPFVSLARKILTTVQAAYGRPVDIEFAWNNDRIYILQCRSLATRKEIKGVVVPQDLPAEDVLFLAADGLSTGFVADLEYIVYVDPRAYDQLPSYERKLRVGWVIGRLNRRLAGKRYTLMGPGRWGSNDINLGVRASYADINNTKLLVEISFAREGYTPEVSYGTHFFQDLVEADIAILPLYPDNPGCMLSEGFLLGSPNSLATMDPSLGEYAGVVRLIHVPSATHRRLLHVYLDGDSQKGAGVFGEKSAGEPL